MELTLEDFRPQHFLGVAELLPNIVWYLDLSTGTHHFNQKWNDYIGVEFASSPDWSLILHGLDVRPCLDMWDKSYKKGIPWQTTYRLRRRDGQFRWHLGKSQPVKNSGGTIIGWIGTATDIDDLKRIEEGERFLSETSDILSSSLDLQTILALIPELAVRRFGGWCSLHLRDGMEIKQVALAHCDPKKVELGWEFYRKYSTSMSSGKGIAKVIRSGTPKFLKDIDDKLMKQSSIDEEHFRLLKGLGMRSFLSCPLKNERETFGAITFVATEESYDDKDLQLAIELARRFSLYLDNSKLFTEQVMARQEVEKLVKKLQKAVDSRDIFLGICSHELKTPVTSLMLLGQITMRQLGRDQFLLDKNNVMTLVGKFNKQIERLTHLIEAMLDVSRIDSGKFIFRRSKINLSEIATELADKFSLLFKELHVMFTWDFTEDLSIFGDRTRVEQVLSNILNNAIKYGDGKPVSFTLKKQGEFAVFTIEDQGPGISENHLKSIFKRFERANKDNNITGLGLGLFISKTIVDAHQGHIQVKTTPGEGCNFSIHLPLAN